jgi:hypothetical protein
VARAAPPESKSPRYNSMGSLSERRYCAMGRECKLYDPETSKSQKLDRYHKSTICDQCRAAGYTPVDAPASPSESVSVAEELFGELLGTAQALFEAKEADEDVVYPTLVFANEIWQRPDFAAAKERLVVAWNHDNDEAWRKEAERFTHKYKGFAPMKIKGEALFLKQQPAYAVVRNYRTIDLPKEVEIRVYPRANQATREQVAEAYEDVLSNAGIPCDVSQPTPMPCYSDLGILWIFVQNGEEVPDEFAPRVWQERKPRISFPHPRLVGAYYDFLYGQPTPGLDGYAGLLNTRPRGEPPEIYNLIPPCVGFFLKVEGGLEQGEILNVLNKYLLRDHHPRGEVPRPKVDLAKYNSRRKQLSEAMDKVGPKLLDVAALLDRSVL